MGQRSARCVPTSRQKSTTTASEASSVRHTCRKAAQNASAASPALERNSWNGARSTAASATLERNSWIGALFSGRMPRKSSIASGSRELCAALGFRDDR
eukprot:scaffold2475_cov115-Isochrysis_galbana.AAC.3